MIISASRRTDIPAFYSKWFMNSIRAGFCTVSNPFNPKIISNVSLLPEDVDVIVFWTRNPRPMFSFLPELDSLGFQYYFQFTLMNNPSLIDPGSPKPSSSIETFRELSDRIGPEKMIWRYDPIVFSNVTGEKFHAESYEKIASSLHGFTRRSVISMVKSYRKNQKRLRDLSRDGIEIEFVDDSNADERLDGLMKNLVQISSGHDMEIVSCAEDMGKYGIGSGKCVDDEYIRRVFMIQVSNKKDPSQRKSCGCVISKDIGMYNTCLFGCKYCYAIQKSFHPLQKPLQHQLQNCV